MAAIYPLYFRARSAALAGYTGAERLPLEAFMMQEIYDFMSRTPARCAKRCRKETLPCSFSKQSNGHSCSNWRGVVDHMLRSLFGT